MSKIIVIGSVNSSFRDVFGKLEKLQPKQQFAFAIVAGDLFGETPRNDEVDALIKGDIPVPLPTYFTVGLHGLPKAVSDKISTDDEVCPNLYYLERRGVLTTSEGVKIVALGGASEQAAAQTPGVDEKYIPKHTEFDSRSLYSAQSADILITNQWPKSIQQGSNVPVGDENIEGSQCISDLCSVLRPRYHFSSFANFFYEREPFFHLPADEFEAEKHITRFINLAQSNNTAKEKWLYAFTFDLKSPLPTSVPAGTTLSPLAVASLKKRGLGSQKEAFSRFSHGDDRQRPSKRARKAAPTPSECFFCLSNENVETHLITSIGTDCYMTTAKGPLPTSSSFPQLGFPGHMLIIPLTHTPTFATIEDSSTRSSTYGEMQRYRTALHSMLLEKAKGQLGAITWEVSRGRGVHIHWQFLPVSSDLIDRGLVEAAFKVEAENLEYPNFEKRDLEDGLSEKGDYFRVWIWTPTKPSTEENAMDDQVASNAENTGSESVLVLPISSNFRFDVQFGRTVMAKLLELEDRGNWRNASQTEEEETKDAKNFKAQFEKFDFSLTEE
ncbi:hypothetical protein FQN57_006176 [Myotisia sp. PD_48]|nr:hypothetical protein FQN57_006176 [Myotisia sp. PD_48]